MEHWEWPNELSAGAILRGQDRQCQCYFFEGTEKIKLPILRIRNGSVCHLQTLPRLENGEQSVTLRGLQQIMKQWRSSLSDILESYADCACAIFGERFATGFLDFARNDGPALFLH